VSALLRYLAVAHYGRGRGEWQESEYPPFWRKRVVDAVAARRPALAAIWALRTADCQSGQIESRVLELVANIAREMLDELYPGALGDLAQVRSR